MASSEVAPGQTDLKERYEAVMVLGAAGDAMGYYRGNWEFDERGESIHADVRSMGGVPNLLIEKQSFPVSDDTILHIATAEGLASPWKDREELLNNIAKRYVVRCKDDMWGRSPGPTTLNGVDMLRPDEVDGLSIPFNKRGGGCGAAMRSCPIGLAFSQPDQIDELIAVSIESGRLTHNHPTGFLGSLASALFVSYGIQGKPLREWGQGLLQTLDKAEVYVEKIGRDVAENKQEWSYFKDKWIDYLRERDILDGDNEPKFPAVYDVTKRDSFYISVSFNGWGGASGHDAPMIAYDALLGSGDSWEEVCLRGVLHGGDSDSTGIIAASAWGAMYGFKDVPDKNYRDIEFGPLLKELSVKLHKYATSTKKTESSV